MILSVRQRLARHKLYPLGLEMAKRLDPDGFARDDEEPIMAMNRQTYELKADTAAKAAKWMQDEMDRRQGVLTLDQAWEGVNEQFGSELALRSATDAWLCRSVLSAFRKLTPEVIWDPVSKQWRNPRRNDSRSDGARMLDGKSSSAAQS